MFKPSHSVCCLFMIFLPASGVAGDTNLDRAIKAISQSLPQGWTVAERKSDEIPWGHHWSQNYTGPRGLLVIVKGTRPVDAEFSDPTGRRWAAHVATESLDIWVMPSDYSDSFRSKFSIGRPIQPTVVVANGPIRAYARPSHLLLSQKDFNKILSNKTGVSWPDSPVNSPRLLTWKDWKLELKGAIQREFAE
jgi:hypothetical protein